MSDVLRVLITPRLLLVFRLRARLDVVAVSRLRVLLNEKAQPRFVLDVSRERDLRFPATTAAAQGYRDPGHR